MSHLQGFSLTTYLVMCLLCFQQCQPKAGDPGPKGDTGANGAQGATGPAGSAGATGTANVQYSPWITTTFSGSSNVYVGIINALPITQDVLDKADIRIYWKDGDRVISLPYAETTGNTTLTVHVRFYVARIEVRLAYLLTPQQFRYVIIPGATLVGGRKGSVDYTDYEATRQTFNIPD
ncbi:collagen-like protein [Spirosoma aureum]|uniref:Collagen-like protein n=1 Tax=Spirosoma aureum TaxID=2692134 RepID=A0A6G9AQC3_9BACT|nr:collagen-like protein [Spirosoma aureum]QIP14692.1 collagen-like protein [Spirosoma aureum]